MSVYYLRGTSNYGDSSGIEGYYYPLYLSPDNIVGQYHQHSFIGLNGTIFYMPTSESNHGLSSPPTVRAYNGETYLEYGTRTLDDDDQVTYTNLPTQTISVTSLATYTPRYEQPYVEKTADKESSLIDDLIPIQLRESSAGIISLLEDYYTYLNSNNQALNISKRILSEHDIDEVSLDYLSKLKNEIAITVPSSSTIDPVSLYKRIIKYYSIRGSEESILVFFRLFFDEVVNVIYPKDFLLKPSEGDFEKDNNILNYNDTLTGISSNDSLDLNDIGDKIGFYNSSDASLGTGSISRIEAVDEDLTHPDTNLFFLDLDSAEPIRYNSDANTFRVFDRHNEEFSQTIAELKGGTTYDVDEGFIFNNASNTAYEGSHIDMGQIYATNPYIITQATNSAAHTMIARINPTVANNAIAHIFREDTWGGLMLNLSDGKLAFEVWRWGHEHGYSAEMFKGSTDVVTGLESTVAVRGKRDSDAVADGGDSPAAAAGDGYVEVSVNGETWERVWDDADYGTPTSFDINNALLFYNGGVLSDALDLDGFVPAGTSSNGKPYYETTTKVRRQIGATSNFIDSLYITSPSITKFRIEYFTNIEHEATFGSGVLNGVGSPKSYVYNTQTFGAYVLYGLDSSNNKQSEQIQIWYDWNLDVPDHPTHRGGHISVYRQGASGIMMHPMALGMMAEAVNDGFPQTLFPTTNTIRVYEPMTDQVNNFYDMLKKYERRFRQEANQAPNEKNIRLHTFSPIQLNENFTGTRTDNSDRRTDGKLQPLLPQIYSGTWVTNGKQLTTVTTKDFLDVKDSDARLRLGLRRTNHHYIGKIKSFSYYQKLVTQNKLTQIHNYEVRKNYPYKWAMRVNVDNDASLTNLNNIRSIVTKGGSWLLTQISGPLKDAFWTYDETTNNPVLTGFKVVYETTDGSEFVNFGDGSSRKTLISSVSLRHQFGLISDLGGQYYNRKGFISDVNKLQDSNFWQDYSYQIKGKVQLSEWENQYLKLVHPAGLKMFSALALQLARTGVWQGPLRKPVDSRDYNDNPYYVRNIDDASGEQLTEFLQRFIPPWKTLSDAARTSNDFIAEQNSFHMPFYQPGWLTGDAKFVAILIQALVNKGVDPRDGNGLFLRTMQLVMKLFIVDQLETRDDIQLRHYDRWIKWFDRKTRVADYHDLSASDITSKNHIEIPKQSNETNLLKPFLPWSMLGENGSNDGSRDDAFYERSGLRSRWNQNGREGGDYIENFRLTDLDPFGRYNIIWRGTNRDLTGSGLNADGGFRSPYVKIDKTKVYRFSCWVKQEKVRTAPSNNITSYAGVINFGLRTWASATSSTALDTTKGVWSGSTATTVPNFFVGGAPAEDEWFLFVGFVRPSDGTNTYVYNSLAGFYNTVGEKVNGIASATGLPYTGRMNEYAWGSDVEYATLMVRYNIDGSADTNNCDWWGPRIEVVDGSEPTITELIFPSVDPSAMYGVTNRPSKRPVRKFNNISPDVKNILFDTTIHSIQANDYIYDARNNYNENLKFLDSMKISSYFNNTIKEFTTNIEEGYEPVTGTYRAAGTTSGTGTDNEYGSSSSGNGGSGGDGGGGSAGEGY